jgi:signal transduction histidine kinase
LLLQALQGQQTLLRSESHVNENGQRSEIFLQAIPGAGTIVSLPLWYKETCEGVLIIVFAQILLKGAPQVLIVEGSAPLLAEALASARLHTMIDLQRQRFYTILDQLPKGVLLVEAAGGTISYANPADSSLLGVPHATLVGTPLHQMEVSRLSQEPSTLPWHFALIHALWGKTISSQELVVKRADGSHAVLLSSTAPLYLEAGENITEAVIAFQDITLQKTIEEQKSTFLAMVNHELRTPLTAVLGFCDLLQQHGMDGLNEMQAYAITSIVEQSEYLTSLVNEILDQSALEHASFELHRTSQDLLPLLVQVIEQHRSTSNKHHIQLHIEGISSQTCLMGQFDSYRVIQVFNNVLTNAVKYSPSGGMIEVGIRLGDEDSPERNTVLLWVKDQGLGIAPTDLPHIFERFYRAAKRDQSVGGLGLGLYLAKELIQRHGGRIWAESKEGVGTTFFLVFPLSLVEQKKLL